MLNPAFSKSITDYDDENYILGASLIEKVLSANIGTNTGKEYRLQKVYGYEIWKKLDILKLKKNYWDDKSILDICCGTGFVSYHLLDRINPNKIVLMDINENEMIQAKKLLSRSYPTKNISFISGNALTTGFKDNSFDVVIGNSFLHHFYSIPQAFTEFKRILKPGGAFISLHEPTVAAVALESGQLHTFIKYLLHGDNYIDSLRGLTSGIAPGKGQDIWIFNDKKVERILRNLGFVKTLCVPLHLFRPFYVAKFALHLNEDRQNLSRQETAMLKICITVDTFFSKIFPPKYFGSICIKGEIDSNDK